MNKDKYFKIILFSLVLAICFPFKVDAGECRVDQITVTEGYVNSQTPVGGVLTSDNSYTYQAEGDATNSGLFCIVPSGYAGFHEGKNHYECIDDDANYDFSNCTDSKSGPCILAGAVQILYDGELAGDYNALGTANVTLFRLWAAAVNDQNFKDDKYNNGYTNAVNYIKQQVANNADIDPSVMKNYLNAYETDPYVTAAVNAIYDSLQGVPINSAQNVFGNDPQITVNPDGSYNFDYGEGGNISGATVESVEINTKESDNNSNSTANSNKQKKYLLGFIPRIDAAKSNLISWIYPSLTGYSLNKVKESNNDSSKIYAYAYDEDNLVFDSDKKYISLDSGSGITVNGGSINVSASAIATACEGNPGGSLSVSVSINSGYKADKINFYRPIDCPKCQLYGSIDAYDNPVDVGIDIPCPEQHDPCEEDPTLPECQEPDCEEDPTLPGCPEPDCEEDPTLPGCPDYPSKPQCSLNPSGGLTCGPSVMEDPKMCAIINVGAKEYSKAGNSYCTVYCREKLEFDFMDKETAQAGRYFRHHLGGENQFYTVTVQGTRECASSIDYDRWKQDFIDINKSILDLWNTLKRDEALLQKDPQKSSGGGCTGCDGKSQPNVENFTYKWGDQEYSISIDDGGTGSTSNAVASESKSGKYATCKSKKEKTCGEGDTPDEDDKCYECTGTTSAASPLSQSQIDEIQRRHNRDASTYDALIKKREQMLGDIYACSLGWKSFYSPSSGTFDISTKSNPSTSTPPVPNSSLSLPPYSIEGNASASYDEETACDEGISIGELGQSGSSGGEGGIKVGQTDDYCSSCGDPKFASKTETDRLVYWNCSGSLTGAKCVGTDLKNIVPNNYIVQKSSTASLNFSQNKSFSTEIFTGKLVSGGSEASIPLPEHSWPICTNRETSDPDNPYHIYVDINIGNPSKGGSVTCDYEVVNETTHYDCDDDLGVHVKECYDCDDPSTPENECNSGGDPDDPDKNNVGLGFYFRSIDLREVFPGATYSPNGTLLNPNRPIGSNWNTANAIQIVKRIENLEKNLGTFSQDPEYVVTLTPTLRKKISENNREEYGGNYFIPPSSLNGALKCDGKTLYCSSTWLSEDLRAMIDDDKYFIRNDNYDDDPKLYKGRSD